MRCRLIFLAFTASCGGASSAGRAASDYVGVTKFFDNDADNLRLMHAQGWISDDELVEMLGGDPRQQTGNAADKGAAAAHDDVAAGRSGSGSGGGGGSAVWPLEQVQCKIGRFTAMACSTRSSGRTVPLGRYRSRAQMCATWDSMCDPNAVKVFQIAIPKAASTSLDNVLRRSPLLDPCYVPLCCGGEDGATLMQQLDYENSPKHEVQYMTSKEQLKHALGVECGAGDGNTDEPGGNGGASAGCASNVTWSLSTKYQQPCNYVSAHGSHAEAFTAMERGVANVQVVTMLREPVARIRSAFLYTAKRDWASGKHTLGVHAHPEDMDVVEFMKMNTLYAGSNLQTRLIAGAKFVRGSVIGWC
jgi:hypothetical protein